MPDTLPTVTSSTITGEFCGSVATSGSSTVIEYEPIPCPDVPGMSSEFSPPNWQPASSTTPDPSTTALRPPLRAALRIAFTLTSNHHRTARWAGAAADREADRQAGSGRVAKAGQDHVAYGD